jgi:hypothetical protein
VTGVPTLRVGERLFWGDDQVEAAAAAAASLSAPRTQDGPPQKL